MRYKSGFIFVLFITLLAFNSALSQVSKYSNEFMSIGVGSRALGMSNSHIASTDDITSGFWNPAGLVHIENNLQVSYMHSNYFAGIGKHDYGALGIKISEDLRIGLSMIRFGVDDIPNTLNLFDRDGNIDYNAITTFSVADYGFIFSIAKKSAYKPSSIFSLPSKTRIEQLSYGANVKIINRKAAEFAEAWGFGIDIGMQYRINNWRFGIMARDITTTFNAWSFNTETFEETFIMTGNEIPTSSVEVTMPTLIPAFGYKIYPVENFYIYPELNFDMTFDGKRNVLVKTGVFSVDPHAGIELGYGDFLYVRGGIGGIQNITETDGITQTVFKPNMGVGLRIMNFTFDYALTDVLDQFDGLYSNVISIKAVIDKKEMIEE